MATLKKTNYDKDEQSFISSCEKLLSNYNLNKEDLKDIIEDNF